MSERKSAAAASAANRRTRKGQLQTRPAVKNTSSLVDLAGEQGITHEIGTHTSESQKGKRPDNWKRAHARTLDSCRKTLSGTTHVLVTYPQRRTNAGPPQSALMDIIPAEPSSSGASQGSSPALAFNSRHKHLKHQ